MFRDPLRMHQQQQQVSPSNKAMVEVNGGGRRKVPRVSFSSQIGICSTLHWKDYTNEEYQSSFYNRHDYQRMNDDIKQTVERIENPTRQLQSDCSLCTRGIEYKTRMGGMRMSQHRTKSVLMVLSDQDCFLDLYADWDDDDEDDYDETDAVQVQEEIAKSYSKVTQESVQLAYLAGIMDEQVALRQDDGDSINDMSSNILLSALLPNNHNNPVLANSNGSQRGALLNSNNKHRIGNIRPRRSSSASSASSSTSSSSRRIHHRRSVWW